jgi:hypothetical protein
MAVVKNIDRLKNREMTSRDENDQMAIFTVFRLTEGFSFLEEDFFAGSRFAGVIFNPGFDGIAGKIMTIKFKVKEAGVANLNMSSGLVLANDGAGTSVATTLGTKYLRLDKNIKKNL